MFNCLNQEQIDREKLRRKQGQELTQIKQESVSVSVLYYSPNYLLVNRIIDCCHELFPEEISCSRSFPYKEFIPFQP